MGKIKIEINDVQNIRDLLQEAYRLADEQIVQSQNEINKLSNATNLTQEAMDAKAKYSKAINDYLGIKDKAISKKLDIAKLLSEIYKYNGDVKGALESGNLKSVDINFDEIKKMVDDSFDEKKEIKTINIRKD